MLNNSSNYRRKFDSEDSCKKCFDPVLVFCRVRPLQSPMIMTNVVIPNETTVILKSPNNSVTLKQHQQNLDLETHYVFKKVFGPTSTQSEVYKIVAQPLVGKLIQGISSLLFSYGVTGSGKTYTMTGDFKELGLMPRCLEALFRSIEGFHAQKSIFQPDHLNGFEIVSDVNALTTQKADKHPNTVLRQRIVQRFGANDAEYDPNKALDDVTSLPGVDERNVYAVFISYTEVYNNCVYDLLEECSVQRCLQSRIVREDANHNMYVHGVTEIEISSVLEALEAFQIGQKHKKIGHTMLNAESSRSHSVFNIRLVQAPIGEHVLQDKSIIRVSQLSLVDLAGSERSSRTNNSGARLRETGNINNSLMTLRTCLEYLRENQQMLPGNILKKIPYRDSKITQLFKNFFEGEGQVSMIACINPGLDDFSENSQVMKFAEITQEVQIPRATTVQISTNEVDIIGLLRSKFNGYEFDVPSGDGPLSEKLIFMFQKYLQKKEVESSNLKNLCDKYHKRVTELEAQNLAFRKKIDNVVEFVDEICERNKKLESEARLHIEKMETLTQKMEYQISRLDAAEENLKKLQLIKDSRGLNQQPKSKDSTSIDELLTGTTDHAPKKINFKLINKFIELVERDEL